MTETSSLITTYSLPSSYSVTALPAAASPALNGHLSPPIVEEEEYTIKCICGYNDDDGNTVFCDKCETWQHIECYYHGTKVPDVHFCTDCAPKDTFPDINADKARERQRRAREALDGGGDRRVKRPAAKSQKKKHRDTITGTSPEEPVPVPVSAAVPATNGWSQTDRQGSLSSVKDRDKDQPPPVKKTKTSHRASTSIASLNGLHGESRKRAHSNVQSYPSPSKSPQEFRNLSIPRYTTDFLELYNKDVGNDAAADNELTVRGSNVIYAWKADSSLIALNPENAQSTRTPFVRADTEWAQRKRPKVSVETKYDKNIDPEGKTPTWKFLRLDADVRKNTVVGEIRGQIGTLDEYCQQLTGSNRWKDLQHPDPFVFFHPHMEIYIDSRRSGTPFRYIRRSCEPNVTMRSYITADDEVRHCFVAKQDIPAGTELTTTWYLGPQLPLVNDAARDDKEQLFQESCEFISKVLANFGDCACPGRCQLEAYDRRSNVKTLEQTKSSTNRRKKQKIKVALSPLSNGQPTVSRAGSETIKGPDDEDDQRSSSPSSGNDVRSRDLTPQGGALLDAPPMLGASLTQREIRKIQALEKSLKEQSQKTEKKQKKRPSGVSHQGTPVPSARHPEGKQYSVSPPPAHNAIDSNLSTTSQAVSKRARPVYVTASVQTDPEACAEEVPPFKRRKFSTPTQRLLKKLLHHRTQSQSLKVSVKCSAKPLPPSIDVQMRDATTSVSPSPSTSNSSPMSPVSDESQQPKAPLPSQAAHTHKIHTVFKTPAPRLNLSTLPPVPAFMSASVSMPLPNVTTSPVTQSPGMLPLNPSFSLLTSSIITPSPAKKKLSLGDYMNRRKESSTPVFEKPAFNVLPFSDAEQDSRSERKGSETSHRLSDASSASMSSKDITKAALTDEQAVEDTPMHDVEGLTKIADVTENTGPVSASAEVQGILSSLYEMNKRQT